MGVCSFCGNKAGLFKKVHRECEEKHDNGLLSIVRTVQDTVNDSGLYNGMLERINKVAVQNFIAPDEVRMSLARGFGAAVEQALEDGVLTAEEEEVLKNFIGHFDLKQADLDAEGAYTRLVKGVVLREIVEGKIPDRVRYDETLPFNLQKSEQLVWLFPNTPFIEERVSRTFVGGSQGGSIRIAKGVYYRVSAFKGTPVETVNNVHLDTGLVAITTKHIYFAGPSKSFRVPYAKIVSFRPYDDGVGVYKDGANAKPMILRTGDGWFTYNLVVNLSQQ